MARPRVSTALQRPPPDPADRGGASGVSPSRRRTLGACERTRRPGWAGREQHGRVDQREMGERLGKVAEEALADRVVLLRDQTKVVREGDETPEQGTRLLRASDPGQRVGEPE